MFRIDKVTLLNDFRVISHNLQKFETHSTILSCLINYKSSQTDGHTGPNYREVWL